MTIVQKKSSFQILNTQTSNPGPAPGIVTTAVSTFGYVAHGLAGVRPWVLLRPPSPEAPVDPACVRSRTVEPCLQALPRRMCGVAEGSDIGALVPYARHCEDEQKGLKLFP